MSVASELDVQREPAANNQSLFREVNERIEELSRSARFPSFICDRYVVVAELGASGQVPARLDGRRRRCG